MENFVITENKNPKLNIENLENRLSEKEQERQTLLLVDNPVFQKNIDNDPKMSELTLYNQLLRKQLMSITNEGKVSISTQGKDSLRSTYNLVKFSFTGKKGKRIKVSPEKYKQKLEKIKENKKQENDEKEVYYVNSEHKCNGFLWPIVLVFDILLLSATLYIAKRNQNSLFPILIMVIFFLSIFTLFSFMEIIIRDRGIWISINKKLSTLNIYEDYNCFDLFIRGIFCCFCRCCKQKGIEIQLFEIKAIYKEIVHDINIEERPTKNRYYVKIELKNSNEVPFKNIKEKLVDKIVFISETLVYKYMNLEEEYN